MSEVDEAPPSLDEQAEAEELRRLLDAEARGEGGSGQPGPGANADAAAAALLRYCAGAGELGDEPRARIREALLARFPHATETTASSHRSIAATKAPATGHEGARSPSERSDASRRGRVVPLFGWALSLAAVAAGWALWVGVPEPDHVGEGQRVAPASREAKPSAEKSPDLSATLQKPAASQRRGQSAPEQEPDLAARISAAKPQRPASEPRHPEKPEEARVASRGPTPAGAPRPSLRARRQAARREAATEAARPGEAAIRRADAALRHHRSERQQLLAAAEAEARKPATRCSDSRAREQRVCALTGRVCKPTTPKGGLASDGTEMRQCQRAETLCRRSGALAVIACQPQPQP